MAVFPEEWIQELLSRVDIVSLIGQSVSLKEKNNRFWGNCPFHGEKTPSFSVQRDKQFFYCFGCHVGGNAIHFVMQHDRLNFVEAVKALAEQTGLPLPERLNDDALQKQRQEQNRLLQACKQAALFFHHSLLSDEGEGARAYLEKRQINPHTQIEFGLGFAPKSWDALIKHMKEQNFSELELKKAGLILQKGERFYDAFRGRLMFPIIDIHKNVIGFGARALGEEQPKYLNSAENAIFNKRKNLFGFNRLKGQKLSEVIVVEGYMDVISLTQHGVSNAVASLGTALTQQQARLIKRYCDHVVIAYDGDSAGQNAMIKGMDILSVEGLTVKIMRFPNGMDPDDFIRSKGLTAFDDLKQKAMTLIDFKINHLASQFDLAVPEQKEMFAKQASRFIATLQPLEKERYFQFLSRKTGYSIEALQSEGGALTSNQLRQSQNSNYHQKASAVTKPLFSAEDESSKKRIVVEKQLLRAIIEAKPTMKTLQEALQIMQVPFFQLLIQKAIESNGAIDIQTWLCTFDEEQVKQLSSVLALKSPTNAEEQVMLASMRLQEMDVLYAISKAQSQAETANTQEKIKLVEHIRTLHVKLDQLKNHNKFI